MSGEWMELVGGDGRRVRVACPGETSLAAVILEAASGLKVSPEKSTAILDGCVLDQRLTMTQLNLLHRSVVLLSAPSPPGGAAKKKPLFDQNLVSGMLAQLNLDLGGGQHAGLVRELMEMGFSEARCQRAVQEKGNNFEHCSQWLVATIDDASLDVPLIQRKESVAIQRCIQKTICTLAATGTQFEPQKVFQCFSCALDGEVGVCSSCAESCHRGHQLDAGRWSEAFFCDCALLPSCQCLDMAFDADNDSSD